MGKYFDAKKEIYNIETKQQNEIDAVNKEIDDINNSISVKNILANWKYFSAKIKINNIDLEDLYKGLLVFDIVIIIACIAILLFKGVSITEIPSYIFLQHAFTSNIYKKALWSAIPIIFAVNAIDNLINYILSVNDIKISFYRHLQRVIFTIINLITIRLIIGKYNELLWNSKFKTIKGMFRFAFEGQRNSRIVMAVLLIIGVIFLLILAFHICCLLYCIIHDAIEIKKADNAKKQISELENDINLKNKEIDDIKNKYKDELQSAKNSLKEIQRQGKEYYNEAIKTEPYDEELIKKAMEYDNPDACYYYCYETFMTSVKSNALSEIEFEEMLTSLRPYAVAALEGDIISAEFFYVNSMLYDPNSNGYTKDKFKEFLNKLLNAKKSVNFDKRLIECCVTTINNLDEIITHLEKREKEEAAKEIRRNAIRQAQMEEENRMRAEAARRAAEEKKREEELYAMTMGHIDVSGM